jgi:diguanylate cyclase (GGDEF)-like protein
LAPRDRAAAARTGGILTMIAAVITAVFTLVYPPPGGVGATLAALIIPVVLLLMTLGLRTASRSLPDHAWVLFPVVAVIGIATLDLITRDASAAGQVFLCYPVLYAASQLQRSGAAITAVIAIAADALVVFALQSPEPAITNFCYVTATLVAMTVLLVHAGEVNVRLITQLRAQAAIDPLTGLVTRRTLDDAAQSAISSSAQDSGTALILIDIDHFKIINDTYGHPVGDDALIHVATILTANSRRDSVTCRMGGDELAILLPGCSADGAIRRAGQLLDAIRSTPLELADGTWLAISVSVGVAHIPSHAHGLDDLYQAADGALYGAKRRGRGSVGVADPKPADVPGS